MTKEDTHATDPDLVALPTEPLMPPTQALTTRFDVDTSGDIGRPEPRTGTPRRDSLLVSGESRQGFRIGEVRLMIRYEDASELSEMSVIHRLPNAPAWFCGIANLHGKLTPVFDLARYIGVDPDPESKRMLLVLASGSDAVGVVIDGLPERLRWTEEECTDADAAPERLMPHLRGASYIGGRQWFDLDPRSLLGAMEQSLGASQ